jgi:regulatory protein
MAGVVTALEAQKRNKKRVNVYLDGVFAFSLSLDDAARLRKGQSLTDADIEGLRGQDEVQRAVDTAARFLGHRPRSTHEVRQNLAEKEVPPLVIDAAVEQLQRLGYLDDLAFAAYWVKERNTFKPISPRALRYELRQKGVDSAVIDEALHAVDADDTAYRAALTQARRLRERDRKTFAAKLVMFLQRRGFAYGEARAAAERVMDELAESNPTLFAGADDADWGDDAPPDTPLTLDEP